jgi:hypothetical protein
MLGLEDQLVLEGLEDLVLLLQSLHCYPVFRQIRIEAIVL